ncbi:hypothetical protein OIU35_19155 [Boseaceae bacterium BT-24-1]|nr:hypothetical protein [Boseaceae bacterium BT-24-1]
MISTTTRIAAVAIMAAIAIADVSIVSTQLRAQTATSGRQANAESLLANMRRALATILVAYKAPDIAKSHAGALVLNGTKDVAVEVGRLTSALASGQARAISEATRKTSEGIGRLDGIFRMAGSNDQRAVEGIRALSANWATYTARYALARPMQLKAKASATQVVELQRNVARLRGEVGQLRTMVRRNATVVRDLDMLYARIDRLEQRRVTEETYHSALVALSAINGVFIGYEVVSRVYYPDIYMILHARHEQFSYYQGYWDGYYDAYYASWPTTYYEVSFEAPDATVVNVDVTINQQVETYSAQNIDVFVQETEATEATFEVTPTPRDVEERPALTAMDSAPDAAELAETVKPDAKVFQSLEGGGATPASETRPVTQEPSTSPAARDNDDNAIPTPPTAAPTQLKFEARPSSAGRPDNSDSDASAPEIKAPKASRLIEPDSPAHQPRLNASPKRPEDQGTKKGGNDDDDTSPFSTKEPTPLEPNVKPRAEGGSQEDANIADQTVSPPAAAEREERASAKAEQQEAAPEEGGVEPDYLEPPATGAPSPQRSDEE